MAERRMFAKSIIDSDVFLDMPLSTQALYFHLAMSADDDGFINNPKRIMRAVGATGDEFKLLLAKRYLLSFDSGVVVIKHWRMHNYIQKDRYKETHYIEEMDQLTLKDNKSYTEADTQCIHNVSTMDTQVRLDKVSIDKYSIGEKAHKRIVPPSDTPSLPKEEGEKRKRFTPPTVEQIYEYGLEFCREKGFPKFKKSESESIFDHYKSNGWKVGGKGPMKDWKSSIRNCIRRDAPKRAVNSKEIEAGERRREEERQELEASKDGVELPSVMGAVLNAKKMAKAGEEW